MATPDVLLDDARDESPSDARLYADPAERVVAHRAADVPAALERVGELSRAGYDMAGHIAYEAGLAMHFALLTPDGQQMIGACNFSGIIRGAFQACYLGYHIDYAHQGQGLMQEGLEAGIGYMFDTQNLHRIMANYIPGNERSARLLERLGFEREGYAKAYLNIAGRWQDHVLTALVNPVFEAPEKRWSRQLA